MKYDYLTPKNNDPDPFSPTAEQSYISRCSLTADAMRIDAVAGGGATAALRMIAMQLGEYWRIGEYVSYRNPVISEAKTRFPRNVACHTAHSFAFSSICAGTEYGRRCKSRVTPFTVNSFLKIRYSIEQEFGLKFEAIGWMILDTLSNFYRSIDPYLEPHHASLNGAQFLPGRIEGTETLKALKEKLVGWALDVWHDQIYEYGKLPIPHDAYLKMWQLSEPVIPGDFIFFDETQDASPAIISAVQAQDCQIVFAGDPNQQTRSWNGDIDTMNSIKADEHALLTTSFSFSSEVADLASRILAPSKRAKPLFLGQDSIATRILTQPAKLLPYDCFIARTNGGALRELMLQADAGNKFRFLVNDIELIDIVEGISCLNDNKQPKRGLLCGLKNLDELKSYLDTCDNHDVSEISRLVELYGSERIIETVKACSRLSGDTFATVANVNRVKHSSFKKVKLANDFIGIGGGKWNSMESRLLYIAATRATDCLDISGCEAAKCV